jgi:hypothetical protein
MLATNTFPNKVRVMKQIESLPVKLLIHPTFNDVVICGVL